MPLCQTNVEFWKEIIYIFDALLFTTKYTLSDALQILALQNHKQILFNCISNTNILVSKQYLACNTCL